MIRPFMTQITPQELEGLPFELVSLAQATRYQKWVADVVEPWMGSRILEIGSGIGNMSRWLPRRERLVLTEADPKLFKLLERTDLGTERHCWAVGTPAPQGLSDFDTVVSFNVLEHIEDDESALRILAGMLSNEGVRRLVTFVPAHQWAHGSLDREFGHFRRYSDRNFSETAKRLFPDASRIHTEYVNAAGLLGWWVNGRVLGARKISDRTIRTFETLAPWMQRLDRVLYRVPGFRVGQSLLAVIEWR